MSEPAVPSAADVLRDLRGLRSAPPLTAAQRQELRAALMAALAGCEWFTVVVMAPSAGAALAALRACERALGWPALQEQAPDDPQGPVFLKGNQRTGAYLLRGESGLGEGILITGHNPADPSREDTWGPLPLDLFDGAGSVGS
ncbi:MAG: DUF1824 family protein [Cyanobium sp.]